jgi:hypothetical protein
MTFTEQGENYYGLSKITLINNFLKSKKKNEHHKQTLPEPQIPIFFLNFKKGSREKYEKSNKYHISCQIQIKSTKIDGLEFFLRN